MRNIKTKSPLPIKPTEKPGPQEMAAVAISIVNVAQKSILSPAAVIATLRCALDLYRNNAIALGFHEDAAVECEKLGQQLAEAVQKSGAVKTRSAIAVPDTGLVSMNGAPLTRSTIADAVAMVRNHGKVEKTYSSAPGQCENTECNSTAPFIEGSVNSKPGWVCGQCRAFYQQAAGAAGAEASGA